MIKKDIVIIGASAAGISAAIYLARHKSDFIVLSKNIGGEVSTSGEVENYPGFIHTTGIDLALKFEEHIKRYGEYIISPFSVSKIENSNSGFIIYGEEDQYLAKAVIFATGGEPKKLGLPGEDDFTNKGISYCTVCDGPLFKDKTVVVIGGANSASESGIMLSGIAKRVYILTVNEEMKGDSMLIQKLSSLKNVEIITNAFTQRFLGKTFLDEIEYEKNGEKKKLEVTGAFINIGWIPNSKIAPAEVEKSEYGYIKINTLCRTSIPGLFAAGDITDLPHKQIGISVGHGITAALEAISYINKLE